MGLSAKKMLVATVAHTLLYGVAVFLGANEVLATSLAFLTVLELLQERGTD